MNRKKELMAGQKGSIGRQKWVFSTARLPCTIDKQISYKLIVSCSTQEILRNSCACRCGTLSRAGVFLLHEEFQKPTENIKVDRLSRHLYDLDRLADTTHCEQAMKDTELYRSIIAHRQMFNPVKNVDYANHERDRIDLIPPKEVIKDWQADYAIMQESMIYGDSKKFSELIVSMKELIGRFREIE